MEGLGEKAIWDWSRWCVVSCQEGLFGLTEVVVLGLSEVVRFDRFV